MPSLNGIPLPLALLLWAFNILFNPLAIGSCPKGHITRHKPIVKKGLTDLPSIETFLKYLHWVGLETCLNYSWDSERSTKPQTSLKEAVLMSWLSQTWEMKWFSSIGKSWSCTIKSEFCSMHLVERDIIGDLIPMTELLSARFPGYGKPKSCKWWFWDQWVWGFLEILKGFQQK